MLAAQTPATPKPTAQIDRSSLTNSLAHPEWPEFRGSDRAGCSLAPRMSTNWNDHPPKLLWKIPVGPGWSSLAVAGRMLFTQDQRGPKETVLCYDADSGREIWKTEIDGRLDDPMGGPGPRATPTLANGALYVVGSTGTFLRQNPARLRVEDRAVPSVAAACRGKRYHSFAHRHEHGHARDTPQEEQWPIRRGRTLDLPSTQAGFRGPRDLPRPRLRQ